MQLSKYNLKHDRYFKNKQNIYEIIPRNLRSEIQSRTTYYMFMSEIIFKNM